MLFFSQGTILAAANILGMDAVGVDLSLAKTQRALRLCECVQTCSL